jgi:hypothetical protein
VAAQGWLNNIGLNNIGITTNDDMDRDRCGLVVFLCGWMVWFTVFTPFNGMPILCSIRQYADVILATACVCTACHWFDF